MPESRAYAALESSSRYDVPWIVDGVWLAVDDIDALAEQARAAGGRILSESEDTPHGRQCRIEDPEGLRWMLGEP